MLETWLQAVLHHSEAILNKELLELIAVPGVVMAWVRKHSKLLEQHRNEARASSVVMTNTLLFVDLNSKNDAPNGADPDAPRIADLDALSAAMGAATDATPSWNTLCSSSPLASFYARAALASPGVRAVVSPRELEAPTAVCVAFMPRWFNTGTLIDAVRVCLCFRFQHKILL